jgi:hypothetical protein
MLAQSAQRSGASPKRPRRLPSCGDLQLPALAKSHSSGRVSAPQDLVRQAAEPESGGSALIQFGKQPEALCVSN